MVKEKSLGSKVAFSASTHSINSASRLDGEMQEHPEWKQMHTCQGWSVYIYPSSMLGDGRDDLSRSLPDVLIYESMINCLHDLQFIYPKK